MASVDEIRQKIATLNAKGSQLNNERQVNLGRRDLLVQQLQTGISAYEAKYGIKLTEDDIPTELTKVSAEMEESMKSLETLLELIETKRYDEATKLVEGNKAETTSTSAKTVEEVKPVETPVAEAQTVETPVAPAAPQTPVAPVQMEQPVMPTAPQMPVAPVQTEQPVAPAMPTAPQVGMPTMPSQPMPPQMSMPNIPSAPIMPTAPTMPSQPTAPQSMPNLGSPDLQSALAGFTAPSAPIAGLEGVTPVKTSAVTDFSAILQGTPFQEQK